MKFRDKEVLEEGSGAIGSVVTDGHTPGICSLGQLLTAISITRSIPKFGECWRQSTRKPSFTKSHVAYSL